MELTYQNQVLQGDMRKTLVVEDDEPIRLLLQKTLVARGHAVTAVESGQEAWEILQQSFFPMVLLDWMLPGLDGLELCKRIRALPHGDYTTILLATAKNQPADWARALEAGADDYMTKPFSVKLLDIRLSVLEARAKEKIVRRLAEAEADEARSRYERLLDALPDFLYQLDPEGRFTYVAGALDELGYTPADLLGHHFTEILDGEDAKKASREEILRHFTGSRTGDREAPKLFDERRAQPRRTRHLEVRIRTPEGTTRTGEAAIIADICSCGIYDNSTDAPTRTFLGSIGIIRDVTEQRQAARELHRHRLALEELLAKRTDNLTISLAQLQQAAAERQRAEAALRDREERFRLLVDNAFDLVSWFDHKGNYLFANPRHEAILGVPAERLVGTSLFERVHPSDWERSREAFAYLLKNPGKSIEAEGRYLHADGSWRILSLVGVCHQPEGQPPEVLVASRDVTERRAMEKRLQEGQRLEALGRLASGIAHDFNNTLFPVLGYANILRDHAGENTEQQEYAAAIERAGQRAADLVRQLLDFARSESRPTEPLCVHALLREMAGMLERTLPPSLRLQLDLQAGRSIVDGDASLLHSALLNLCMNAHLAMPEGGTLTLHTELVTHPLARTGGTMNLLQVDVIDTGTGMDEDTRRHAFEPFFTTRHETGGTGMGLATAYGTIRQHGGTLRVASTGRTGTTMQVILPLFEAELRAEEPDAPPFDLRGKGIRRVLVMDDDPEVCRLLEAFLAGVVDRVVTFTDPAEGIAFLRQDPAAVDRVVLDMVMPGMGGAEAFRQIHMLRPDLPVYLLSGCHALEDMFALRREGVRGILFKPIGREALLRGLVEDEDSLGEDGGKNRLDDEGGSSNQG